MERYQGRSKAREKKVSYVSWSPLKEMQLVAYLQGRRHFPSWKFLLVLINGSGKSLLLFGPLFVAWHFFGLLLSPGYVGPKSYEPRQQLRDLPQAGAT